MKQGNQFYLMISITNQKGSKLNIEEVKKVQFNIGTLTKKYDEDSEDVSYDIEKECFKIWLTEEETFELEENVKVDIRILFSDDTIYGTPIQTIYFYNSLKKINLVDEEGDSDE